VGDIQRLLLTALEDVTRLPLSQPTKKTHMITKKALKELYVKEELNILVSVEGKIDTMIKDAVKNGTLVGKVDIEVPYTKALKQRIMKLVDEYKAEYGGAFSIIHPINFNETKAVWKPSFTIQLQSVLNE